VEEVGVGQALVEGLMDGEMEGLAKARWADQQEGSQGTAVHVGRKEQAELFKAVVGAGWASSRMSTRETLFGANEVIAGRANAGTILGFAERGFVPQGGQDFAIQPFMPRLGWKVDGQVAVGVESSNKACAQPSTYRSQSSPVTRPMPCSLIR